MKSKKHFLIIFLIIFFFVSCSNHDETLLIKKIVKYNQIDLRILCNQKYDYLVILDEGSACEQYEDIQNLSEKEWLGQKIVFVKDNEILNQINLSYYVSEPQKDVYLSFFQDVKPGVKYIKRDYDDSIFAVISKQQIGEHSVCYYLQ